MKYLASLMLLAMPLVAGAQGEVPIHLWLEPEWFPGVSGSFAYWTGAAKPTGAWGIAGPGISAEWSQGGESEWNSMGVCAEETKAQCHRAIEIPRAGKYRLWVRYVDHRRKSEPFRVVLEQAGNKVFDHEFGVQPIVPENDEYQLFWGFSFGWGSIDTKLEAGPARLIFRIDRAGEAWRQVDAMLLTTDLDLVPHGREKPEFAYQRSFDLRPTDGAKWRGKGFVEGSWQRPKVAGRDFSLWTGIEPDPKWWGKQNLDSLKLADVFHHFSPPSDIRDKFHKQFPSANEVPLIGSPALLPGFYLGNTPDLSPGSPVRQWLEKSKTPFYIMTNYAAGNYDDRSGPATFAALTGAFRDQFLGYIHGEAVGTMAVSMPEKQLAPDRRGQIDAIGKHLRSSQGEAWSKIYKTPVPPDHRAKSIPCLSVDSIALAHLFHETGSKVVGYEIDATNVHVPMRIAFERGAARQYGGAWINYASGNFGDSCNYFTQNPVVPRGAPSWFHSKYAVTDGVSIAWYRKLYYLNFLGGASAIYWEQSLNNQWILPGPGTHPIQLSPFGRATEDFMAFVQRLPDRGEPCTPIALLLSHGHGYERVNNHCKMLTVFPEDRNDLELRELFNVCWHPAGILEGKPASPDVQSMPSGVFGDIFDVLVDRPEKSDALFRYPVVWAAGDVKLDGALRPKLQQYLNQGGTLVISARHLAQVPQDWLGFQAKPQLSRANSWSPAGGVERATTPFDVQAIDLGGAQVLAKATHGVPLLTRHSVGQGAVLAVLVPNLLGVDERAHPVLPYVMHGLTDRLLPIDVRLKNGRPLQAEVMFSLNSTKSGWLVALYNQRGIDKTQNGIARVDRSAYVDVELHSRTPIRSAKEWTTPRALVPSNQVISLRVHPGDLQVVEIAR